MCAHFRAPGRSDHHYPPDDKLIELMAELRAYNKVAAACGVRRESLRDYLKIRPALKQQMEEHSIRRDWETRTTEEREAREREQKRQSKAKLQREDPEKFREINRRWARNQSPEKRAKWNNYNRLRRREAAQPLRKEEVPAHLYLDPCSYCSGSGGTIDHIIPIKYGGDNSPENLTAACRSCNCSKNDRPLLGFLLSRRTV